MIRTFKRSDITNWDRLRETGSVDDRGNTVVWSDKLQAKLENDTSRIQSAQVIAQALNGNRMGKYHTIAERITALTQKQQAEGDRLMARMDELEKRAPAVIASAHSYLDQQNADLDVIDSGLRQLSNALPLDGSQNG